MVFTEIPIVSFNTSLYNPGGASKFIVTSPVSALTSDIYDFAIYSDSVKLLLILSISFSFLTSITSSFILFTYSFFR